MADALVSNILMVVLKKLGSVALEEIGQVVGVKNKLIRLEKTLSAINAVLLDAEQQQFSNQSVKTWLHDLKDVTYDIEDVLDLISTQYFERQVNGTHLFRNIRRKLPRYGLAQELKVICCRLEDIAANRRNFSHHEHHPVQPIVEGSTERETYSFVEETHIFRRKPDSDGIINCLLTSSIDEVQHPHVFPITGMGGMGKTTLAQLVINDPRVVQNFELRIWANVSKKFVLKTVIANILQSATGENCLHLNMEALQKRLHDYLVGQTFLLVLDDVWIEDSKQWHKLKELLDVGSRRSTIIVTTREERVASLTRTSESYKLNELSEYHSWSIFVKTLGSLLHHERDFQTWKRIEESDLWKIHQGPGDILPALKLSFDHTPYHLRLLFASCAMFGKGYPIYRSDLISLWMAQGLLHFGQGSEDDPLDVGHRCFDELLSRSFFQLPG